MGDTENDAPVTAPETVPIDDAAMLAAMDDQGSGLQPASQCRSVFKVGDRMGGDPMIKVFIMAQRAGTRGLIDWIDTMIWNGHMVKLPCRVEETIRGTFSNLKKAVHPDKVSPQFETVANICFVKKLQIWKVVHLQISE